MKYFLVLLALVIPFTLGAWELTASNSHIRDIPTVFDFMPIGVACELTPDNQVIFPPSDPQWRLA